MRLFVKAHLDKKNVIIVSSDKDLMQLVDNKTVMLDPMKHKWIDIKAVEEKFGVKPNKVIDVQALAGDPVIIFLVSLELDQK